jgi:peptide deformylase
MSAKKILIYPKDKQALRDKSVRVQTFDKGTRQLIRDLKDTLMAHSDGIGLAAPQINVYERVVVVRLKASSYTGGRADPPIALVNPEIVAAGDERRDFDGCLSFPGLYGETVRPHYLRVTGMDEDGKPFDKIFEGFDAVLVHHEIDHLQGVLFIDRIEKFEDLYRVYFDDDGIPVRVPVSEIVQGDKRKVKINKVTEW